MARATFTIYGSPKKNNPARKVGTLSITGASHKKADAAGRRILSRLGIRSANARRSESSGLIRRLTGYALGPLANRRATRKKKNRCANRKRKPVNFGQRMARLRAKRKRSRR